MYAALRTRSGPLLLSTGLQLERAPKAFQSGDTVAEGLRHALVCREGHAGWYQHGGYQAVQQGQQPLRGGL